MSRGFINLWLGRVLIIRATYVAPSPADLQRFHYASDKYPPSQSKRWKDPNQLKPAKAPSSSRNRKEAASPVDSTEGRRTTRDRDRDRAASHALPSASSSRAAPVSSGKAPTSSKQETKKKAEHQPHSKRNVSIASPSPSRSPPPNGQPPHLAKRRSTMNSRDAAYEEQVKAALEASRMESATDDAVEDDPEEANGDKGETGGGNVEEKLPPRKGKRKREDDDAGTFFLLPARRRTGSDLTSASDAVTPVPASKPKHPNQYTYRPKPVSAIQAVGSPARRAGPSSTPVPSLPPPAQHEHGTRRAGAIANGIIPPPPNSVSVHNLHWHLPDHLSAFSDLLPGPHPIPIEARAPRSLAYLPRSHFLNQKYGPFSEERDENHKLLLPEGASPREITGNPNTQLEPPARIRYPAKRMTTADMRKRVRNLLEYAHRVQTEESRRKERAKLIGIDVQRLPKAIHLDKDGNEIDPLEEANRQEAVRTNSGRRSSDMLDELVNDLILLQEGLNGLAHGITTGASPIPPLVSAFESSAPATPSMPSAVAMETAPTIDTMDQPMISAEGPTEVLDNERPAENAIETTTNSNGSAGQGDPPLPDQEEMDVDEPEEVVGGDPVAEAQEEAPVKGLLGLPESTDPILPTTLEEPASAAVVTEVDSTSITPVEDIEMVPAGEEAATLVQEAEVPVDVYREGQVKEVVTQPEEIGLGVGSGVVEQVKAVVGEVEV